MPQKTETISITGYDERTLTALAYGALESLKWTLKYAVEKQVIAYTPRSWNKYDHEINVEVAGEQLTVTSKHIHGEIADLPGRNKKFIAEFLKTFDSIKTTATEEQVNGWKEKISSLQEETIKVVEEEVKQSQEVDKVMNLSKSNLYVTYGIMAINVLVFVVMVASGVALLTPTGIDIIKWGGNFSTLTLSGDWWRLLSCVFVHIGIIHLLFNMYALYMVGVYLEPMLGKARFIAAYLATGVFASLASLWWHDEPVASAGASGAIFGMYGVFLALLSTKLIPKQVRDTLLKSIAVFIAYNLIYGMKSGVDNAAHAGGLISGLIIGYVYYLGWKGENAEKKKAVFAFVILIAATAAGYLYLQQNKVSAAQRNQVISITSGMGYKDGAKFLEQYDAFITIQNKAVAPLQDSLLTEDELIKQLDEISIPEWNKAGELVNELKEYNVSENYKKKIVVMGEYVEARKKEIELRKQYIVTPTSENRESLSDIVHKLNLLVIQLDSL